MKSIIRRNRGMTELLMIFPIFVGTMFVVAAIGFFLIQKTKMEKHAWEIQTKRTYDLPVNISQYNAKYLERTNVSVSDLFTAGSSLFDSIPLAFKVYIETHLASHKKMSLEGEAPAIVQNLYRSAYAERDEVRKFNIETTLTSSSTDSTKALFLMKEGLWQSAMSDAGFGAFYPLQIVGLLELSGIPVKYLGLFSNVKK